MASPIPWTEVKALSFDIFGTFTQQDEGMYKNISSSLLGPYLPQDRDVVMEKLHKYDGETQRSAPSTTQPDVLATSFKKYAEELKVVESGKATQGQVDDAAKDYGSQMPIWPAFPGKTEGQNVFVRHLLIIPFLIGRHCQGDTDARQAIQAYSTQQCRQGDLCKSTSGTSKRLRLRCNLHCTGHWQLQARFEELLLLAGPREE